MAIDWVIFDAMGVIYEVADDVGDSLVPFLRSKNYNKEDIKELLKDTEKVLKWIKMNL